ncbi:hypothetical protein B0H14DRAFT_2576819 [Mycena olivaceomarginata]|nr:hypothetical protein B0H14DRAFT_2576819 [Mycena olivaceomarginata]
MSASVTPCHACGRPVPPPSSPSPPGLHRQTNYIESRSPSPASTFPSPTPTSMSENPLPLYYIEIRSPSPTPTSPGSSPTHEVDGPSTYTSRIEASTPSRVQRQNTYTVRIGREGEVYSDLHEARKAVAMVVVPSLSRAIAWINRGPELDIVLHRQAVLNALAILRAEQSDTDMEFEGDSESSILTEGP